MTQSNAHPGEAVATVKAFDAARAECQRVEAGTRFAAEVMPGEREWYRRGAQTCAAAMGMLASNAAKTVPLAAWPLPADALDGGSFKLVPVVPTEEQWGGLARAIMMWLDMTPKTPRALFKHLERSGHEIPGWLRDDAEMKQLDHAPSKGTRCYIIYRAMVEAGGSPQDAAQGEGGGDV